MSQSAVNNQEFVDLIRVLGQGQWQELRDFFVAGQPISIARAPGRLDVMGGIADYSGSLVLQWPIQEATYVAVQQTEDQDWSVASLPAQSSDNLRFAKFKKSDRRALIDYTAARDWFQRHASRSWASYLIGVALVLRHELGADIDRGLRILVWSTVPEGKGVSSSAALEVATMRALTDQLGIAIDGAEAARLCQLAENHVVGAACGIMDQMTSALGEANQLFALLCQPAHVQDSVEIPDGIGFWGIDSGLRHAVGGSDYTAVRTGAFMGYRMIASLAKLEVISTASDWLVQIADPLWQGYLANLTPDQFEQSYAAWLPQQMSGEEFLRTYQNTSDTVTRVQAERVYAIQQPTAHPIYEHARVSQFRSLLKNASAEQDYLEMGKLMYASHESYSACGLGSDGTDQIVELVRTAGPSAGLYGARITGGGSGGTVAVLGRKSVGHTVQQIADQYARESGRDSFVFDGSSVGAWNDSVHSVLL